MSAVPCSAEPYKPNEDPLSVILKWRPTADVPEMPDFVTKTRPADDDLHYTPLTAKTPERPKLKTKDELKAATESLDKSRDALHRKGGAAFARENPQSTVKSLQAAAAEARRRAAGDAADPDKH